MQYSLSTSGPETSAHGMAENLHRFYAGEQQPNVVDFGKGC